MCCKERLKPIRISSISMEEFETIFDDTAHRLNWNCLFVLPFWLKNWWQVFGTGRTRAILAFRSGTSILGVAPLMLEGHAARFLGSESVCDYQDMIFADNCPDDFFSLLLDYLRTMDVCRIELGALRPDSRVLSGLSEAAKRSGYHTACAEAGKSYALELPKTWEGYLDILDGNQRHEIRRKIRRLNEAGRIDYHVVSNKNAVADAFDEFLMLFQASRQDKAEFLTDQMKSFFRSMAITMAQRGLLQLGFLSIDGKTAASTLCFEYANTVFLYNNGYRPEFQDLSVGSLGKIFSIKHAIEKKKACYDFLKGDEAYKERLGGRPLPLYRLTIDLNNKAGF